MNDRSQRLEAIFHAAKELATAEQRDIYVRDACKDDSDLSAQVQALLKASEQAEALFRGHATQRQSEIQTVLSTPLSEASGTVIGRYKLLEKIGEGGFGVVYVAEQREPVKRRVALKIIKLGMDTKQVIARFEAERQALALMDHPNIAKILDAGSTDTGRPYFVMELVRGIKITDYCDQDNLSTSERLKLFIQVCHAIQHAHQKGVIHRDIKPSNILVTLHDGVPVPKVIDFGIAKATQQELTEKTVYTQLQQFIGTPAYMSPEQAEMSGLDIDTRSDIYSLGVLLYELLTGKTPFDAKELLAAGLDEMRRMIREKEPVRPSTRLTMDFVAADVRRLKSSATGETSSEEEIRASSRRLLRMKELIHLLRGDLDWIVMKALEKDRQRRYESASALGQDVERHLRQEPVNAAAPSATYKFRKFARRNRVALTTAGIIVVVLVAGVVVSTWQAVRATRAEKRAVTALATSDAVSAFLQNDLLAQASPLSEPDRDLKVRTVLDRAAQKIEGRFTNQPLVEAAIRKTIVQTYHWLAEPRTAEPHAQRAVELYRSQLGPEHPDTLMALKNLADAYDAQGKRNEAETIYAQVLESRKRGLGLEHPDTLDSMANLAWRYSRQNKLGESETLHSQALDIAQRVLGLEHPLTLELMENLSNVYRKQGSLAKARALRVKVLEVRKRVLGPEHPHTLWALNNMAHQNEQEGNLTEAVKLHSQSLEIEKRVLGLEHHETLKSMNCVGIMYRNLGRLEESEKLHSHALEVQRRVLGPERSDTLTSMNSLALTYQAEGKLTEAEKLFREGLQLRQRNAPDGWETFQTRSLLGAVLSGQNRFEASEPLLLAGYEGLKQRERALPPYERFHIRQAAERLVQLYDAWGKPAQATEWKQKLEALPKPE